ncbi:hypothetical protein RIF29_28704 [Crotalaria pallida]|uniref:Uncharacterized protein n=1 Tax=Crotalaria pallida TaxID=3830 RepID=A0AAN9ED86_CROPI
MLDRLQEFETHMTVEFQRHENERIAFEGRLIGIFYYYFCFKSVFSFLFSSLLLNKHSKSRYLRFTTLTYQTELPLRKNLNCDLSVSDSGSSSSCCSFFIYISSLCGCDLWLILHWLHMFGSSECDEI